MKLQDYQLRDLHRKWHYESCYFQALAIKRTSRKYLYTATSDIANHLYSKLNVSFFINTIDKCIYCYECGEKIDGNSDKLASRPVKGESNSSIPLREDFNQKLSEGLSYKEAFDYLYEDKEYGVDRRFSIPNSFLTHPEEWYEKEAQTFRGHSCDQIYS